ncbi:MAG: hypothetical protein R3B72_32775 [Polyangiaceae bacterium]
MPPLPLRICILLFGLCLPMTVRAAPDSGVCIAAHETGLSAERARQLRQSLEQFRICADAACPDLIRDACRAKLQAVDEALPRLEVRVVAPGEDGALATILVDGAPILAATAVPLDPGRHQVEVILGAKRETRSVLLQEGGGVLPLEVVFAPVPPAEPPHAAPPSAPAPESRGGIHPATWALVGVGAAGLITFGVAGGLGKAKESELVSDCKPNCRQEEIDVMRTRYLVADIGLGVALAGAIAATVVALTVDAGDAQVTAAVTAGGMGLRIGF